MDLPNYLEPVLDIEALNEMGHGIGSWTSATGRKYQLAVVGSVPGDQVSTQIRASGRRRRLVAPIKELIEASAKRVEAPCPHFGSCGGCSCQALSYEEQLLWKQAGLRKRFSALEGTNPQMRYHPIMASQPWHYRNKMEFSFSSDRQGRKFLGLMQAFGRGRVVDLQECHLAPTWFAPLLVAIKAWWEASNLPAYELHEQQGLLRTLTCRQGKDERHRLVMLTVMGTEKTSPLSDDELEAFLSSIYTVCPEETTSVFLQVQVAKKGVPTSFHQIHLAGPTHLRQNLAVGTEILELDLSPTAFFQPNTLQAGHLFHRAFELGGLFSTGTVRPILWDLYCGIGTLGLAGARYARSVYGIELNASAVHDAQRNCSLNQIDHAHFISGDVGTLLGQEKSLPAPDIVFVDPPRAGLDENALAHLIALRPPKIVYISCNPKTQVENIQALNLAGYQLTEVQPVDQFPHTPHLENIAILTL